MISKLLKASFSPTVSTLNESEQVEKFQRKMSQSKDQPTNHLTQMKFHLGDLIKAMLIYIQLRYTIRRIIQNRRNKWNANYLKVLGLRVQLPQEPISPAQRPALKWKRIRASTLLPSHLTLIARKDGLPLPLKMPKNFLMTCHLLGISQWLTSISKNLIIVNLQS